MVLTAQLEVPHDTVACAFALARRSNVLTILDPAPSKNAWRIGTPGVEGWTRTARPDDEDFKGETIGQHFARLEEERRLKKLQKEAELAKAA